MASHILKRFRDLMALKNISIYVLPRTDEHQVYARLFRASIYVHVMREYLFSQDLLVLMH